MHIVSLVGEQAAPSLVVLRTLSPKGFTLVCTDLSKRIAGNIRDLVRAEERHLLEVPPYRLGEITRLLREHASSIGDEIAFDLTGGTKTMALAAYAVAQSMGAKIYYLKFQGEKVIFEYTWEGDVLKEREISLGSSSFTLSDYLGAYLGPGNFDIHGIPEEPDSPGKRFEKEVYEALAESLDEVGASIRISGALELDLAFRKGISVGVAEVKTGRKACEKRPLEQLNAACAREHLGTYTKKVLIIDRVWDASKENLIDLARAWKIKVIELPSFGVQNHLSPEDKRKLQEEVTKFLEGGKS